MNVVLRTVIVDCDNAAREQLKSSLTGVDLVWIEAEYTDFEEAWQHLAGDCPDIVLVGIDSSTRESLEFIGKLSQQSPGCGICAVSHSHEGQLILRAIRAGAKEFLSLPVNLEDLLTTLNSLGGTDQQAGKRLRKSKMIAVAGVTGGVGTTSLAVNMGTILAAAPGASVVVIDLDLTLGNADVLLDTIHDYTLADLTQNITRLDFDLLRRSLAKHKSGLFLLPRPVELDDAALVTEESLRRIFSLLKASFSHIIVDLSKGYNDLDLTALECCDAALVVTQLDVSCLRNVVRLLKSFRTVDGLNEKVKIVVNRSMPGSGTVRLKKAQEVVGQEFFWQLPNDYRLMVEVCNNGVPLIEHAPRAELTQSLIAMSRAICGEDAPAVPAIAPRGESGAGIGRWFSFWQSSATKAGTSRE
jgi:pilus assembly protein CpaE